MTSEISARRTLRAVLAAAMVSLLMAVSAPGASAAPDKHNGNANRVTVIRGGGHTTAIVCKSVARKGGAQHTMKCTKKTSRRGADAILKKVAANTAAAKKLIDTLVP